MEKLYIDEIKKITKGQIVNGSDGYCEGVSIDSRNISKNDLFFALPGNQTDGHEFVCKAYIAGASAAIVEHEIKCDICQIIVPDVMQALRILAKAYRDKFNIPFIAITGSSGKTTTKDIVAQVLSQKYNVLKTQGNFNSQIGVPLTLFNLNKEHEIAVIEMGMSSLGEIEENVKIVRPHVALITNVGIVHVELLGSKENILKAKCEILSQLTDKDLAIVNGDDELLSSLTSDTYKLVKLGIHRGDTTVENIVENEQGVSFDFTLIGVNYHFDFRIPGIHNVYNCIFAVYVGYYFGLEPVQIQVGFNHFKPSNNRMHIEKIKGIQLVDDTYNCNPDALKAAYDTAYKMSSGRCIVVAGDMFELGENAEAYHQECAGYMVKQGMSALFATGDYAHCYKQGAVNAGLSTADIHVSESKEKLAVELLKYLQEGDTVLFKASRGAKFEDIVTLLKEYLTNE